MQISSANTLPKNLIPVLVAVVVVAALGYLIAAVWAGLDEVGAALRDVGWLGLVGVFATSLFSYAFGFVRWQGYLRLLGHQVPRGDNLGIYVGSFALAMTPARAGEVLRSVFLRRFGVDFPSSFAAFAAERIVDLLAMALIVAVGLWSYPPARPMIGVVIGGILAVLLVLNIPRLLQWFRGAFARLPRRFAGLAVGLVDTALNFRSLFGLRGSSFGLGLGLLVVGAEGLGLWILLEAQGANIPVLTALAIYGFSLLAGALSFLPGGVGGFEAAMILLLTANGLSEGQAVATTLLIRVGTLWFAVLLGIAVLPRVARAEGR
ncbi:MAG: lysylphosphatidylglycerol synthase transmembrane domain-containing protein [Meiothermus sp.]|nr:lysylphosphatidylglycerol synthase transmembrane domain-containing protein [Meiothermus sp.]